MTDADKLNEEVKRYYSDNFEYLSSDQPTLSILTNIARHFYELGCRRTAEKFDEIEYNRQRAEESVPNDLDFEQELYNRFGQIKDFTLGMRIGKYFYELGKQSGSSEITKDLEEAAGEYAEEHGFRVPYDGSNNFYDDVDVKASKEGFISGAKWQAEQVQETIELAEDHAYLAGADWQKEQMLKEAVEGEYDFYPAAVYLDMPIPKMNHGDKVRIIVIPNTDEK